MNYFLPGFSSCALAETLVRSRVRPPRVTQQEHEPLNIYQEKCRARLARHHRWESSIDRSRFFGETEETAIYAIECGAQEIVGNARAKTLSTLSESESVESTTVDWMRGKSVKSFKSTFLCVSKTAIAITIIATLTMTKKYYISSYEIIMVMVTMIIQWL